MRDGEASLIACHVEIGQYRQPRSGMPQKRTRRSCARVWPKRRAVGDDAQHLAHRFKVNDRRQSKSEMGTHLRCLAAGVVAL